MRYIVLTGMAVIGGLFTAGLVFGAAELQTEGDMQMEMAKTEMQQQEMATLQLDGKQIREMQNALNAKGFSVGTEDGIVGPMTNGAIRAFQTEEGLAVTGQPDVPTLNALGLKTDKQEFMGVSPAYGE